MYQEENKAGLWIALSVSIPLAAFTIWRAWDLMAAVLPSDQSIAAIFGVAALDGGMVAWVWGYMKAKGSEQRRTAGVFAFVDFLGVGAATALDLTMSAWHKGLIAAPTNLYMAAIILISVAVIGNVGAGWLYTINDPKKRAEMRDEKAHSKINDLADAQIEKHAAMYAPQFAQIKVAQWLYQAQMLHGHHAGQPMQLAAPTIDSTAQALPTQLHTPSPVPQQPPQKGFFGKIRDAVLGTGVPSMQPLLDAAERMALLKTIEELREAAKQSPGPLQQPPLDTQASQAGSNGNGQQ